jgi:hypothetical protein
MSLKRYINMITVNENGNNEHNEMNYDIIEYYNIYYNRYYSERAYYNRIIGLDID